MSYEQALDLFRQIYVRKPWLAGDMTAEKLEAHIQEAARRWVTQ